MARWVYFTATGYLSHQCRPDATKDSPGFATIDLPDDQVVKPELDRVDAGVIRPMTVEELTARELQRRQLIVHSESRREDILATIAWVVRRENPAAFDALTNVQKRNLILQQAEVWRTIRDTIRRSDYQ